MSEYGHVINFWGSKWGHPFLWKYTQVNSGRIKSIKTYNSIEETHFCGWHEQGRNNKIVFFLNKPSFRTSRLTFWMTSFWQGKHDNLSKNTYYFAFIDSNLVLNTYIAELMSLENIFVENTKFRKQSRPRWIILWPRYILKYK